MKHYIKNSTIFLVCIILTATTAFIGQSKSDNRTASFLSKKTSSLSLVENTDSIDLDIPQTLNITRPQQEITTQYSEYFITGTSNPDIPLYFEEELIERQGDRGTFGVLVELKKGKNTFSFTQEENKITSVINREIPEEQEIQLIDYIVQSSMSPTISSALQNQSSFTATCIAPAGAEVYASFGESSKQLIQVADAQDGVPARFSVEIPIHADILANETKNIGNISYTLDYKNKTEKYQSNGDLYVSDTHTKPVVEVDSYLGYVYPEKTDPTVFKELLKMGACDYIDDQEAGYFKLSSGGYLPIYMAKIKEGINDIQNTLSDISHRHKRNGEYFIFSGNVKAAYNVTFVEDTINVILYNTAGLPDIELDNSNLFEDVTLEEVNNTVVASFKFKDIDQYNGYNVRFDDKNNLYFEIQAKPKISVGMTPLENMVIVVDPGHGGSDPGALGLAGEQGPAESDVNLAHALVLKSKLERLGANVYLTRDQDIYYSLDNRLRDMAVHNADLFVSLHHNSIEINQNSNSAYGTEVYYHTPQSAKIADDILYSISESTGRKAKFSSRSYFRVTIPHQCPSVLVEIGFISNPLEYEKACNYEEIEKVCNAISLGIIKSLL